MKRPDCTCGLWERDDLRHHAGNCPRRGKVQKAVQMRAFKKRRAKRLNTPHSSNV